MRTSVLFKMFGYNHAIMPRNKMQPYK